MRILKINYWILVIIGLLSIFIFLDHKILLSPEGERELIGCNLKYSESTSEEVMLQPEPNQGNEKIPTRRPYPPEYGNCVADGLAKMNADIHGIDEGKLRYEITICLQDLGYNVPVGTRNNPAGVPSIKMNDAFKCKTDAMKKLGIKESFGNGKGSGRSPPINQGESPFEDNCPKTGSTIAFWGGGHFAVCTVVKCDPSFGEATLSCKESYYSPTPDVGYNINVGPDGKISGTQSSMDGGQAQGWSQMQE